MVKLCLMVSNSHIPALLFHQEKGVTRAFKDCQPFLPSGGATEGIIRPSSLILRPQHREDQWKPITELLELNQCVKLDSVIKRPWLIDMQDTRPHSILFSFGTASQCTRHENVSQFLPTESSEVENDGLDLSMPRGLMGIQVQTPMSFMEQQPFYYGMDTQKTTLLYPMGEFDAQKPLLNLAGDSALTTKITVHPDGRFSFMGTAAEMKDLLSIVSEFYTWKNKTNWRKQSILIPQFVRNYSSEAQATIHGSCLELGTIPVAPLKCPQKVKSKPQRKKKNSTRKAAVRERDLYGKNLFHACESLLSVMVSKKQNQKMAILSLKASGPELPELLTQFSASIAGTGLAVLFSVMYRVACARVPFCASKILSTSFGFGLVWLSWSVNRLRDSIVCFNKSSGKLGSKEEKEEEMMKRVDRSAKEILFGAATVCAVAVLRFA